MGRHQSPDRPSSSSTRENNGNIDGVVSANDTMAGGIIARLKPPTVSTVKVPVTGQDASVAGLQAILAGDQCMTVYKAIKDGGRRGGRAWPSP
ncbi:MAG: substrate-binding domain-containing protein [Geodermatophilaceae bacterium]